MRAETHRVYETAVMLSDDARAELAAALTDSVGDGASEQEVLASWLSEVRRRIENHRDGRGEMIPFEEIDAEIDAMLADAVRRRHGYWRRRR